MKYQLTINAKTSKKWQCMVCGHWHNSTCDCCDESDYYEETEE